MLLTTGGRHEETWLSAGVPPSDAGSDRRGPQGRRRRPRSGRVRADALHLASPDRIDRRMAPGTTWHESAALISANKRIQQFETELAIARRAVELLKEPTDARGGSRSSAASGTATPSMRVLAQDQLLEGPGSLEATPPAGDSVWRQARLSTRSARRSSGGPGTAPTGASDTHGRSSVLSPSNRRTRSPTRMRFGWRACGEPAPENTKSGS